MIIVHLLVITKSDKGKILEIWHIYMIGWSQSEFIVSEMLQLLNQVCPGCLLFTAQPFTH